MSETLEGRSRELLEAPNFCNVATILKDGTPHVVPTWVDVQGDRVLLNSAEGRLWPKNLRRDPRVSISVVDRENPYRWVTVDGRAELTHDGAVAHIDKLAKKYTDRDEYGVPDGEQRILVRVTPERVVSRGT